MTVRVVTMYVRGISVFWHQIKQIIKQGHVKQIHLATGQTLLVICFSYHYRQWMLPCIELTLRYHDYICIRNVITSSCVAHFISIWYVSDHWATTISKSASFSVSLRPISVWLWLCTYYSPPKYPFVCLFRSKPIVGEAELNWGRA